LKIPDRFTLGIEPFEGSPKYQLDARFRYRLRDTTLTLFYDLLRPEQVLEDAYKQILGTVQARLKQPMYSGPAPVFTGK
jgi:uncharacterized protein YfdQ (DUF2303 family)